MAPSSPSSATSKSQAVSYAERAKRASSSTMPMSQSTRSLSTATSNGNTDDSTESNSPSTSSRNLTPSSSVILTRPGTPPLPSASSNNGPALADMEKEVAFSAPPKSPTKPPPANVWAARTEQMMAQRAAAAAGVTAASAHPTSPQKGQGVEGGAPPKPQNNASKPINSKNTRVGEVAASKSQDDPFVVRMPVRRHPAVPVLPSLDDAESWPEMGKMAIASPVASSSVEVEKRDAASSSMQHNKKGEKTKWVVIPPAELQVASDASQSSSRAHSQNRRHQKTHSRQHSQGRNTVKQVAPQQPQRQNVSREFPRDSRVGSAEVSAAHSRADSVIHSRSTSVHSSPMHGSRGRRLTEDHVGASVINISTDLSTVFPPGPTNAVAGPSSAASNGESASMAHFNQGSGSAFNGQIRAELHGPASGAQSRTHSQPHTPFDTRSPALHALPSTHEYRGGSPSHSIYPVFPVNGGYPAAAMPLNSQEGIEQPQNANISHYGGFLPVHQHQQAFLPPYLYPPVQFGYLPPHLHGQGPNPAHFDPQVGSVSVGFDVNSILNVPPTLDANIVDSSTLLNTDEQRAEREDTDSLMPSQAAPNLPPTSSRSRPAPPDESEALSGYRRITTIPVSPLLNPLGHPQLRIVGGPDEGLTTSVVQRGEGQESASTATSQKAETMIFGSVRPGGMKSPSPINIPIAVPLQSPSSLGLDVGEAPPPRKAALTAFSVGFYGSGPRTIRIKPKRSGRETDRRNLQSTKEALSASLSTSSEGARTAASVECSEERLAEAPKSSGGGHVVTEQDARDVIVNVIDLTDRETKWEFGTTFHADSDVAFADSTNLPVLELQQNIQHNLTLHGNHIHEPQPVMLHSYPPPPFHPHSMGYSIVSPVHLHMHHNMMPHSSSPQNMHPPPQHVPSLAPLHVSLPVMSPLSLSTPSPGMPGPPIASDEWEVRDFGLGSPLGYASERSRDDRYDRIQFENDRPPREFVRDREHNTFAHGSGRGRRGMGPNVFSGFGGGYEGRAGGYEGRGAFGGRRGRGGPGGFGRGYRGGGRGGYTRQQNMQHAIAPGQRYDDRESQPMQQQQQQTLSDFGSPDSYFPPNDTVQFLPQAFAPQYIPQPPLESPSQTPQALPQLHPQPPMPMPVTSLSFPIDPTRYQLLGQLEYYFSLQNLAQDLYLRRQMDSRGWIPIKLIASFNRVRQLTQDVQLVHEVLNLSELVEVQDAYVRLRNGQWQSIVLPDAASSTVEESVYSSEPTSQLPVNVSASVETDGDVEDEDEDDVVFVMHKTKQS